jgi:hypothetical protein
MQHIGRLMMGRGDLGLDALLKVHVVFQVQSG